MSVGRELARRSGCSPSRPLSFDEMVVLLVESGFLLSEHDIADYFAELLGVSAWDALQETHRVLRAYYASLLRRLWNEE